MQLNPATILLQAPPQPGGSFPVTAIMMVGMFVVMYFFMIRPQAKKAKEQKKFSDSMNAGESVVTTSGIHGTIARSYEDGTLQVEIGKGMFIKIERSAISMDMTVAARKKAEAPATVAAK